MTKQEFYSLRAGDIVRENYGAAGDIVSELVVYDTGTWTCLVLFDAGVGPDMTCNIGDYTTIDLSEHGKLSIVSHEDHND